ncbi:MAG: aspartate/glutamate racemase family protein [Clostridiales Family XIII bacterium]|jgi:allantoin racemase|nr:aspartate/glutamate racemase family protein [Clostridiales Family XIII bacterium]
MKLLNIVPITSDIWTLEMDSYVRKFLLPDTEVITRRIMHGPASIESAYDEALASPEIIMLCKQAEQEGIDGVFIDCFGDPGVKAARECVDIPVFGGFEPAIYYALGIADRIGIVTVLPDVVSMLNGLIAKEGIRERVSSLRYVNIPVLELAEPDKLTTALIDEGKKAIVEDSAGVIVLGCTAMVDVKESVEAGLKSAGYDVTVIEAAQASLIMLETYVRMGYRHSRLDYMPPRDKARIWWGGALQ